MDNLNFTLSIFMKVEKVIIFLQQLLLKVQQLFLSLQNYKNLKIHIFFN